MVTLMVTFGSIDQSPIYKSDLWIISETPEFCPRYLSVGIRLFQDSPGCFRGSCGCLFSGISGDDGDVSFQFRLFRNPKSDWWLHIPSDGCDQFRDRGSVQQMIR